MIGLRIRHHSTSKNFSYIYKSYLMEKSRNQNIECIWESSIKKGDIGMFMWLKRNYNEDYKEKYLYMAAGTGRLNIVKFCYNPERHNIIKEWASLNGQKEVINWLKSKNT